MVSKTHFFQNKIKMFLYYYYFFYFNEKYVWNTPSSLPPFLPWNSKFWGYYLILMKFCLKLLQMNVSRKLRLRWICKMIYHFHINPLICINIRWSSPPRMSKEVRSGWMGLGPNGEWDVAQRIYRDLCVHLILLLAIIFFGAI